MFPLVLAACAGTADHLGSGTGTTAAAAGSGSTALGGWGLSAVPHVWVIVLENQGCRHCFATPTADPNLTRTLPRMGALLEDYYEIGHGSTARYVALVSGQARPWPPRRTARSGRRSPEPWWPDRNARSSAGCIYPAAVPPPRNQLCPARPAGSRKPDAFLAQWVPKILAAPAYRDGALIAVAFNEGSDAAACCGKTSGLSPAHLDVPEPGKTGPGGGRIGAILLSPLIKPGTVSTVPYNHYSLPRTIEDIFGLPHLGDAGHAPGRVLRP